MSPAVDRGPVTRLSGERADADSIGPGGSVRWMDVGRTTAGANPRRLPMRTDSTMVKERLDLRTSPLHASFAVKDIDAARDFYKGTLGLDVRDDTEMGIFEIHGSGDAKVLVYPKPDHKPASSRS
jgi:hypothetical protein